MQNPNEKSAEIVPGQFDKGLYFLPLGGVGEIGMNFYAYGCDGHWLVVDCGIGFAGEKMTGVDILVPEPAFFEAMDTKPEGIVFTHAHEDHIGAVGHLWHKLKCPIYATAFTAELIEAKLDEYGLLGTVEVNVLPQDGGADIGPFDIEFVPVTHSIPEATALRIETPYGILLHSGDWKFDNTPPMGRKTDKKRLAEIGKEGVLALMGDSTNVLNEGHSRSESEVRDSLAKLISGYKHKVAVACFASNVTRVESIALAAKACDRQVCLVGRSLWRVEAAARTCGYLADVPDFLDEDEAPFLPDDKILYICTGSQGEPRSALSRIAADSHRHISLGAGDTVIFSSRVIPGNEKSILQLQNNLIKKDVDIVTEKDAFVHVTGHPAQEEMREMYRMIAPKFIVPIHGEARHLAVHAEFAAETGAQVIEIVDGDIIRFAPGTPEVVATAPIGILALDGQHLRPLNSSVMRSRVKISYNRSAQVTLVMDKAGNLKAEPIVTAPDLVDALIEGKALDKAVRAAKKEVANMADAELKNDDTVCELVRIAVRRALYKSHGQKPLTTVHLVRI